MSKLTKNQSVVINKIVAWASLGGALVMLVLAGLAWWGGSYATNMVHDELAAQKVYFPTAGSAGFSAADYPDLQKYGGQLVDNGDKAKAYANGYINRHLQKIANGKTYAEVSSAAMADPTNAALQQQKESLFQGETLRGILLGTGYAYGLIGKIALLASAILGIVGVLLVLVTIWKARYLWA